MSLKVSILSGTALAMAITTPAHAGWIQSFGQSERCISLGGACTAKKADFATTYHNPAGAAEFDGAVVGANIRFVDTRNVDLLDSAGPHPVDRTNTNGDIVVAPTISGFLPIGDKITVGLALGVPFAITADWSNDNGQHRFNMSDQSLFVIDLSPSVAMRFTDRLSVGLALNIVAFKQLRTESLIPDSFGAALPTALGGAGVLIPTTPSSPVIGSLTLQSSRDIGFGIPPGQFDTSFNEFALTFGLKYKISERFRIGLMGRSPTKVNWKGTLTLDLSPAGIGKQNTPFVTRIDMPAHVQFGFDYDVVPQKLAWSVDLQWTNWADAVGIGRPLVISVSQPLLGFVNRLRVDYNARNTITARTGLEYRVGRNWALLGGYAFDQSIFDNRHVDILTYDSNRHLLSFGLSYNATDAERGRGWVMTGGIQATIYERRKIATGESQNLGGLSLPNLLNSDTLGFSANRGPFSYGGAIFAGGVSLQYQFGGSR